MAHPLSPRSSGEAPELVGGGAVQSYGGWSAILSLRRSEGKISGDQRILKTRDFVERVLSESGEPGGRNPRVRSEIAERLVKELGMSLAKVAQLLGVSTSASS
jgi:hypothetical protein